MKARDIVAMALIAVLAIGGRILGGPDPPDGRRPDPRQLRPPAGAAPGAPLPAESRGDRRFVVEIDEKRGPSTGTAFSIDDSGVWITARHVTDGCRAVALQDRRGRLVRVRRVGEQRYADISLLWTRGGAPALPVDRTGLRIGEDGYSFGFPAGRPGDVHGRVVGRRKMLSLGRYRVEEPVVAWIHVRRAPDRGPDLGGISGGPWVDSRGRVVGVHVAGAPRRGRSYSTAPRTLLRAVEASGARPAADPRGPASGADLTPRRFPRYGEALRLRQSVAKVVCLAG